MRGSLLKRRACSSNIQRPTSNPDKRHRDLGGIQRRSRIRDYETTGLRDNRGRTTGGADYEKSKRLKNWTVKGSCSFVQAEGVKIAAAFRTNFGGQEFLEDCALG